ncbi:hypothetical protein DFH09DRAFT_1317721 [Mycena vulgaris]|nr:hypothetical protein DFH09DRAFT_1317721 [Mycena vulgaris]
MIFQDEYQLFALPTLREGGRVKKRMHRHHEAERSSGDYIIKFSFVIKASRAIFTPTSSCCPHATDSGPGEKDRQLLLDYPVVIDHLLRLPATYHAAIVLPPPLPPPPPCDPGLEMIADYDLYCH